MYVVYHTYGMIISLYNHSIFTMRNNSNDIIILRSIDKSKLFGRVACQNLHISEIFLPPFSLHHFTHDNIIFHYVISNNLWQHLLPYTKNISTIYKITILFSRTTLTYEGAKYARVHYVSRYMIKLHNYLKSEGSGT